MKNSTQGITKDIVLIGGGHTHALLIKRLGMNPIASTRVTLISEQTLTPYSGMLPGFVAGHYSYLDTHIDLNRLCQWSNVRYIRGTAIGLDVNTQQVLIDSQPPISFDQLSIDVGSTPDLSIPGARDYAVGVKPVSQFGSIWSKLLESSIDATGDWGVVGAGAGGVELVLAMAHRLREKQGLQFHLVASGARVLPGYPEKVIRKVETALAKHSITVHSNFRVSSVNEKGLVSNAGKKIPLDKSIWCTGAAAPKWFASTGLGLSERGFIGVNEFLQSVSHANVFAVGDCSDMLSDPRPKAGVYAVRQAPFLEKNLRAVCSGGSLQPVKLQSDFLSLLSLGDRSAVGCKAGWTAAGKWVWKLKDSIDTTFMRKLNDPGDKKAMVNTVGGSEMPMHCAGCGSKLGPDLIAGNLSDLPIFKREGVTPALSQAEDASLWQVASGKLAVQSIDGFRSFSDDLGRFGRICVNHALSDLYAMGATPVSAQVWINLAHAHPRIQKRDHRLLMAAIATALEEQQVTLAGGHSSEGTETHVALVANGEIDQNSIWRKNNVQPGDTLVLTKPLGTGLILAADMQAKAPAVAIDAAFQSMLQSNASAASALAQLKPSSVTDVTGFGLLGHLLEMLSGSGCTASISTAAIPLLSGTEDLSRLGFQSTLYPHLQVYLNQCQVQDGVDQHLLDILLDPQTSGGLLIAIDNTQVDQLLTQCPAAAVIGDVLHAEMDNKADTKIIEITV